MYNDHRAVFYTTFLVTQKKIEFSETHYGVMMSPVLKIDCFFWFFKDSCMYKEAEFQTFRSVSLHFQVKKKFVHLYHYISFTELMQSYIELFKNWD